MSHNSKFGRAVPQRATILPELALDMLDGKAVPPGLGKTHTPVTVLPPLPFDMLAEQATPILQLTVTFRADVTAAQIGRDYHRLYVLLNEQDLAYGGRGLRPMHSPA